MSAYKIPKIQSQSLHILMFIYYLLRVDYEMKEKMHEPSGSRSWTIFWAKPCNMIFFVALFLLQLHIISVFFSYFEIEI